MVTFMVHKVKGFGHIAKCSYVGSPILYLQRHENFAICQKKNSKEASSGLKFFFPRHEFFALFSKLEYGKIDGTCPQGHLVI